MGEGRLSAGEAQNRIVSQIRPLPGETVPVQESMGRILCEPVVSTRMIPGRDNSAMDGYAVRSVDLASTSETSPVALRLAGEIPAGVLPDRPVGPGEALRIFTGGIFPEGADAVVIQENVDAADLGMPRFRTVPKPGENVRRAGEDVRPGDMVLPEGSRIGAGAIALLTLLGRHYVNVRRRPKVAILSTGDELVEPDQDPEGWKTVNSNTWALRSALVADGCEVVFGGILPDRLEAIRDRVTEYRSSVDALISTAGVSVGDYDLVHDALVQAGLRLDFWKVKQRPGAPLAFGWIEGAGESKPFLGLPGNPVSSLVCYEMYARPALRRMQGELTVFPPLIKARLEGQVKTRPGVTYYLRALLRRENGVFVVTSAGMQSSAVVSVMARSNAFIVVGETAETPKPGEFVDVYVTDPFVLGSAESPVHP